MRDLSKEYRPDVNFWEQYPEFKIVDPFSKLFGRDRSSGKNNSSTIMWGVILAYDPRSDFYYLEDKEGKISEALKRDHRYVLDWKKHEDIVEAFKQTRLDQAHKSLIAWEDRMRERDAFLKRQKWSFDEYSEDGRLVKGTADQLDKMHSQTAKHFKEYETVVKDLQALEIKNSNKKNQRKIEVDA